ncbi:MAG: hypothetical protein JXN64_13175 [Spirochaetes bacterium]|nr:hypothetical protein [Spirochaetota bacterium]
MIAKQAFKPGVVFKIISLSVLIVFSLHVFVLPSVFALTVEEQAGKRTRDSIVSNEDEFIRKTPARRGSSAGAEEKDPRLACLLSLIIPGGGHIYLKKDLKGAAFFFLSVAGYSAAGYYLYKGIAGDTDGAEKKSKIVISGLFFLLGIIFHVVGIVEAYNDAIEINEKNYYYGGYSRFPHIARLELEE